MISIGCETLDEFFDGEVPEDVAEAFRQHLAGCPRCSQVLLGRMQEAAITNPPRTRIQKKPPAADCKSRR